MGALLDPRASALSWCRRERIGGDGALAAGPRADSRTLTRTQESALIDAIRGCAPTDLDLPGDLWTRRAVAALALGRLGIKLTAARVTRLLTAWGAIARDPAQRACPMCAGAVGRWMTTAYPLIARTAATHRGELHWIGRARLCGVTPAADVVSAVSGPVGRARIGFMIAPGGPSAALPRDFLGRLSPDRTAHAIVDGTWATWQLPRRVPGRVVLHPMPSCERT
ncbi:Winged helix-turn helix [Asanoa hainanensis]|uniref:Winged helix-turn helix n=1 Tax=Asanoa hainanensis TaxID=560556 RepID=A0A239JWJ2_9ACTN|nr:winged helix-turn-helix domain-containing protein [Asanoa hainanensis]SNT10297.1 Winged helix-turn helix [Asanoa hainanensis]